ncbi:glucose-methanol-choline oxidoreductase [Truncatella angustata]|uniref:Glucose-methanol-choline oxidoreductase n=1 Tax=Truncatella angustata TaxID=152316 RepID=A0A9P8UYK2_9PEZI|nr:glucose-methanol-choline oxidoreductase [Truncatella angustata]KAH6660299.1 glucose-methanol-choline oxidoreductase [Truncatella angustata]
MGTHVGKSGLKQLSTDARRSFDYVIVGGGTSGLTLANRLTEDPLVTVAVIEAGNFVENIVGNLSQVPAYANAIQSVAENNPALGWGFRTTPQPGLNGAVVDYVRAKTLGGCSSINHLSYSRSSKGAFQLLADSVGDQSWTWDQVLPYYRKSMDFTPPDAATRLANATPTYNAAATTQGGPLDITYPAYAQSWSTWVAKGLAAIGISPIGALIEGNLLGSTWALNTADHGTGHRASSDTAYLRPVLGRSNLVVFTDSLAERIIFNSNKEATSVTVTTNGASLTLSAKKEIILSAGVFQSPQLLMVSGVGPKSVLQQYKIPVIADRPGVGQGMRDHILIPLTYQVNLASPSITSTTAVAEFNNQARGPLTSSGGDFVGLEKIPASLRGNWSSDTRSRLAALPADWPEVEYLVVPSAVSGGTKAGAAYATIFTALQAPQSLGSVSIASAKMSDPPVINPNWLTAQADLDVLVAGFRRVRQMTASKAMADVIIGDEFLPGPTFQTDEQILAYFKLAGTALSHAFATNSMGKASDPKAVVGSTGKVYGVKRLRVIDASTFPFLLPGPAPQSHVYMLAEKLADAVKRGK